MLNRSKLYAAGLLFAVFAAGIAVGGAASAALADRRESDREKNERPSYVDRLDRDIGLRPAQRDTIQGIVDDYDAAMHGVWREIRPRFEAIRRDIRARIIATMDSAQAEQYRVLIARSDSVRAARERGDSARR